MKHLTRNLEILLLFIGVSITSTQAQTQAIATYTYNSYGGYETEMTLRIDGDQSHFIYHKEDTTLYRENTMEYYHYYEHYEFFLDLGDQTIVEQRLPDDGIPLISHWKPDLQWEILDQTQEINGYRVQKATTLSYNTSGREEHDYGDAVAWFTTEIPFSTGPNRYYGLPGLIVKIEFTKRTNISFILKDISYETIEEIVTPNKGIEVSKAQIIRPHKIDKKWLKQQKKAYKMQMENK